MESIYEIGGICGSFVIGIVSDKCLATRRSPIAIVWVILAFFVSLSLVIFYDGLDGSIVFYVLMFLLGFSIVSVMNMIVMTVSADLGRMHSKNATSTITGIIDGLGSSIQGLGQLMLGGLI